MIKKAPKITFITSLDVNVGDEFIREGICSFFDEIYENWSPYYVNKVDLSTIFTQVKDESEIIGNKLENADIIVQAGAPVYWKIGNSTSYNVEWAEKLWFDGVFRLGPEKPVLNIAAGACQPYPDFAKTFLTDPLCVEFAHKAAQSCRWTSVRDPLASQILYALNIEHSVLPCAAFHAARRMPLIAREESLVGINLMEYGGHFKLSADIDSGHWSREIQKVLSTIRINHRILFIAHDQAERKFMLRFALPGEEIFSSSDYRDYMRQYARCSYVIANRVHGAVCAAGFGRPAIIVGNDTRLLIADYIGIKSFYVSTVSANDILDCFTDAVENREKEENRLLRLREDSAERYVRELRQQLEFCHHDHVSYHEGGDTGSKWIKSQQNIRLASVDELLLEQFKDFMQTMNCFAERLGLRKINNWSKVWEYPWLWFNALSAENCANLRVLDLGSEISPMPWFLASLGAKVTLIECDDQWVPVWEIIRQKTGLHIDWEIVQDEIVPKPDNYYDLVTSFSVIEHQPNKLLALDEVARVLKPGGLFAVSFDICEPELGMTFPEWNGQALTMKEFEAIFCRNEKFAKSQQPEWNTDSFEEFILWHLQSASHHNYAVGAAHFKKKLFNSKALNKVLLPRFDTFGDIVLLEAFLEVLRQHLPEAELCLLVREGYNELAKLFPSSLKLRWLTVDQQAYIPPGAQERAALEGVLDVLATEKWDLVLMTSFSRTWLDNQLFDGLKGIQKITLGSVDDAITLELPDLTIVAVDESLHETEKYRLLLEHLFGEQLGMVPPRLEVPVAVSEHAIQLLTQLGLETACYAVCLPAGNQNQKHKAWPLERYAEVLCWLATEKGLKLLLLGHENEAAAVDSLAAILAARNLTTGVWLGKSGEIPLLGGLLQRASLFVGTDSGPMHIAAALKVPTVGVFGGGHAFRFLPIGNKALGVAVEIPCFGCYWNCIFENAPCIRLVKVPHVKEAIEAVLGENPLETNLLNFANTLPSAVLEIIEKAKAGHAKCQRQGEECSLQSQKSLNAINAEIEHARALAAAMQNSFSWRITAPLRKICDGIRACLK